MKKNFLLLFLLTFSLGQSQNQILNGTFAAGSTNWVLNDGGTVTNGEAVFSAPNAGGNPWDTELKQTGKSFIGGATYTITFRARAALSRNISVNIQNTNIWTDQFRNNAVALTTTMTTYSYVFVATSTNNNAQLNFHMANLGVNTTAAVYIDDVAIVPGVATQCTNGIQDADETGVDCGGSTCGPCLINPTFDPFTVGPKLLGDAPFTATASSDSPGAITYTSSNAAVATINSTSGLVTILGVGTTTITANQAATSSYYAGSTTATLTVTPPAAPAPPTRNTQDVISFFSDSYAVSSSPTWGGTTNSNIQISGNNTRLFTGFTNGQIAFAATNVSQMTHVRVDVFSVNLTPMWFFLGSAGASKRLTIDTPVNGWVTLDIPLSNFTSSPTGGTINLNAINLFRFENPVGATPPSRTIYIDNIYFYRPETDAPPTLGVFTVPTKVLGDAPFTLTPPTSNSSGAWSYTISPAGIATIDGDVVTIIGGGTATISANQAAVPGEFGPGLASASFVVTYPEPGPSPIPPARDSNRVISLYTGDQSIYTNVPNYNLGQAFWSTGGGRVLTQVPNGTNTALRIDGLGFMGLIDIGEVGPPAVAGERRLNLVGTGMSHLNIDIYLDAPRPNLFLVLLAPSDRLYNTGPLTAGWNTLRVPLTAYPGALNDIYGLKIEQNYTSAFRLFIDNIYFSNDLFTFYADSDGDGFGNLASSVLAETAPEGYVTNSTDCDDTNELVWQTGDFYIDIDGDGYNLDVPQVTVCYGATFDPFYSLTTLGVDCDDNDGTINPGATEICYDGIDQNCDGNLMNSCAVITARLRAENCDTNLTSLNQVVRGNRFSQSIPSG
ncbi:carbohydrate binding domain-containing protein, partial [Flavobacterium sp.]|uniref:carbohydrate binding domain-containing protein n=1 Tax=Flavobacterium sp. TaxID=239 RepID=UPI0025BB1B4B